MRLTPLLLAAVALLAASVAMATPEAAVKDLAVPANDLETARRGLDAAQKLLEIFRSDIFDLAANITQLLGLFSNVLSFVGAFLSLFGGGGESAEMRFMRIQFAEVHARLTGIRLQLDDVKRLINWNTARAEYSRLEQIINARTVRFDAYMRADNDVERNFRRQQFLATFPGNTEVVLKLYNGVVLNQNVISSNLAAAAVHYSRNHRRQTMDFLLALQRMILRGAQMDIAYDRMERGEQAARITERDWQNRMATLTRTLERTHREVKGRWHAQMQADVGEIINEQRGLSNVDFVRHLFHFLIEKYPWRYWFALNYNAVSGHDRHQVLLCGGFALFRAPGNRNVIVASSDKRSATFNKARADQVLAQVDGVVTRRHAQVYTNAINDRMRTDCRNLSLRAAVCWGCNVYHWSSGGRLAYRRMEPRRGQYMHTYMFG